MDPDFFYAYLKLKAVTLKHYQGRTPIDYTPPTYDLGIQFSPMKGPPSVMSSPTKRIHMTINSPNFAQQKVKGKKDNDRQANKEVFQNLEGKGKQSLQDAV